LAPDLFDTSDTNAPVAHRTQRAAHLVVAALTLYERKICARNLSIIRASVMPIRAYLDGHKFDGETVRLMGIAFEMALWSFGAISGPNDPMALAHNIIALAQAGERDPERLCEAALKAVRPPDPLAGSPPVESRPRTAKRPKADQRPWVRKPR
jgi:hypothetical protein